MVGAHQIENAIAALAAINLLEERGEVRIQKDKLYSGLRKAKQIGRFEVLTAGREAGCDHRRRTQSGRREGTARCDEDLLPISTHFDGDGNARRQGYDRHFAKLPRYHDGFYRHRACESAQR